MNPRQCRQCRFYFAGLYAVTLIFDLVIAAGSIPQVPIFKVPDITGYKAAMKFLSPKITGSNALPLQSNAARTAVILLSAHAIIVCHAFRL